LTCVVVANDPYTYCWPPMPKAYPFPDPQYKLAQVSELVRHGDRAPVHLMVYGEDKYTWTCNNYETVIQADLDNALLYTSEYKIADNVLSPMLWHGNCGTGQLTDRGFEQHFSLGKALRDVYINQFKFLPDVLSDPKTVYVRATDYLRTRQSAMSHLAGLWDSNHRTSSTRKINLEVYPQIIDTLQGSEGGCPRLVKLANAQKETKEWKEHLDKVKKTLVRMNSITGCSFDGVYKHSDILHPIYCHNMSLPCRDGVCVTQEDLQVVHDGANFEMTFQYATDEIAKLSVGPFLYEMRSRMLNATQTNSALYALYAAHDFTIAQMFQAFHLGIAIWPPFASHMIFELWKVPNSQTMAIRLLYNGEIMKIPGCTVGSGTACSLEEFDKILADRLTVKSFKECL